MFDKDTIKQSLPLHVRKSVTDSVVKKFNTLSEDPMMAEVMRDNAISYSGVLREGKYRIGDYLNAVKFVSYRMMGDSKKSSYVKTFPTRYSDMRVAGKTDKEISSFVAAYNNNKLVNGVYDIAQIPTYLLNADIHQKAVNRLADLMCNASSEKVQSDSANALLTHLKRPEAAKLTIDVEVKEPTIIKDLQAAMLQLATKQQELIEAGTVNAADIAKAPIVIQGN